MQVVWLNDEIGIGGESNGENKLSRRIACDDDDVSADDSSRQRHSPVSQPPPSLTPRLTLKRPLAYHRRTAQNLLTSRLQHRVPSTYSVLE